MRQDRWRSPALAVAAGAAVVALVAAWLGTRLRVVILDETVYKFAAAQYVDNFPREVIDDNISRGIARFYALVLMPLSWVFDGDVAVRLGRALNALLWAATSIPVFFLARRVVASVALAGAAAVLAVAVPWLTLATILFSEPLAYFLFALVLLAMVWSLEAPGFKHDALVAGLLAILILTRVQFIVLVPAWLALVVWAEWPHRHEWRGVVRRRPVIAFGFAVAVLAVLAIIASGRVDRVLESLGGPYERLRDRDTFTGDWGQASLFEVVMLSLGVGVVPAILAAAWCWHAVGRRFGEEARRVAIVALVTVGAVFAGTLFAQGGWLDSRSEERYFIYAVPLLWVFAAAAIEKRLLTVRLVVIGGLALAAVTSLVPVTVGTSGEQIFLGPVSRIVTHVAPQIQDLFESITGWEGVIGTRDATALVVLLACAATALLIRRGVGAALVPAILLQLVLCGYAVWTIDQGLGPVPGLTSGAKFSELGWVDRSTGGAVSLVQEDAGGERELVFWNDQVLDAYRPDGIEVGDLLYPVNSLPARTAVVRDDMTLETPPARPLAVGLTTSPHLQLDGEEIASSPDDKYVLRRVGDEPRALWTAVGLPPAAQVVEDVSLRAAGGHRVTVRIVPPALGADTDLIVELGSERKSYDGGEAELTFDLCGQTGGVAGSIHPVKTAPVEGAAPSAGRIESVVVSPC